MAKVCACETCTYQVFSDGYCKYHQWMSTKWQQKQKDNKAKREMDRERSRQRSDSGVGYTALKGSNWPWRSTGGFGKANKKRRSTGEREMFLKIWDQRDHVCTNCTMNLGEELMTYYFSHKLGKGAHPEKRLDPNNVQLLCFNCHRLWDQGTREAFAERRKL